MAGKADIVEPVANTIGLTKAQAGATIDAVFECIAGYLGEGEKVQLPGFGTFSVSERAARKGRNPQTGETIQIKASKGVRFRPGKAFKEML